MNAAGKSLRGLIVEDDVMLAEILREQFERAGVQMVMTFSGNSAVPLLKNQVFDFVVTDMQMPDGNGRVVIKYVNQMTAPQPLIFVFSGYNDLTEAEIKELNIRQVFLKPKSVRSLMKQIFEALTTRAAS